MKSEGKHNDNWIPLSKQPPKEDGYYLVSCRSGAVHIDFYLHGKWDNKGCYEILAWQPKPVPYKER